MTDKIIITSIEDLEDHYQEHHGLNFSRFSIVNQDGDMVLHVDERKHMIHYCAFCGGEFIHNNKKTRLAKILDNLKNTVLTNAEYPDITLIGMIHELSANIKETNHITHPQLQQLLRMTLNTMIERNVE